MDNPQKKGAEASARIFNPSINLVPIVKCLAESIDSTNSKFPPPNFNTHYLIGTNNIISYISIHTM